MTAAEVVARVAVDRDFYRNSGGGVTFSGGEPLAQPEFLLALLKGCRAEGIHCALSTSGAVPRAVLAAAEPLVDLFLFDIKALDSGLHRNLTGADNEEILGNLVWLASRRGESAAASRTASRDVHHGGRTAADILVRMPLVPGANDSARNLAATQAFLDRHGLDHLELMPYHELGVSKYRELGVCYGGDLQR